MVDEEMGLNATWNQRALKWLIQEELPCNDQSLGKRSGHLGSCWGALTGLR